MAGFVDDEIMKRIIKYLLIWTVICSVSAIPSLHIALAAEYNLAAMLLGILIFALGYTYFSLTDWFQKMRKNTIWRQAFFFGAGVRLFLSLVPLITILISPLLGVLKLSAEGLAKVGALQVIDLLTGMAAVMISLSIFGPAPSTNAERGMAVSSTEFLPTLFTTILQGIFLNIMVLITILLAVLVQRLWMRAKE